MLSIKQNGLRLPDRMRFIIFILLLAVFSVSCQDVQRTKKPKDLIPEEKMVDVLTELSLLHAARSYNKSMLEETGIDPEVYLWEKYDIDSSRFERSSNYYSENYRQYERIYGDVKERLENLKTIYDSLREEEERVQDSLRALESDEDRDRDSITAPKVRLQEGRMRVLPDTSVRGSSDGMSREDTTR